ncbi:hypothetical protein [Actinomadura rupiterrae]|uniref:hypothetical protein n=1 Tax=Actinomadura rupiterrae TaxID=559627 RepID=UPI0020A2DAF4|nr:hypothetical protein [Actinomadura rupiterrae]MCP2338814.1 hypothetical protein [Actinomadura rupiterrae]
MSRLLGIFGCILVCLVAADSRAGSEINSGSAAWRAGFAAAETEVTQTPQQPGGRIVLAVYGFTGTPGPYARCAALFEVKHVRQRVTDVPVWPMPRGIRLGSKAGNAYEAGWIERCLRQRR